MEKWKEGILSRLTHSVAGYGLNRSVSTGFNLEKAVNHGEHGEQREASLKRDDEKSMSCIKLTNHLLDEVQKSLKTLSSLCSLCPPWFELRF